MSVYKAVENAVFTRIFTSFGFFDGRKKFTVFNRAVAVRPARKDSGQDSTNFSFRRICFARAESSKTFLSCGLFAPSDGGALPQKNFSDSVSRRAKSIPVFARPRSPENFPKESAPGQNARKEDSFTKRFWTRSSAMPHSPRGRNVRRFSSRRERPWCWAPSKAPS